MHKRILTVFLTFLLIYEASAQIGAMKLVGPNTAKYSLGFGAFIKTGIPVSEGSSVTVELGANIFPLKDYNLQYGTIMCPLKAGYKYTLNKSGDGFYVEPQLGYNLVGITSLPGDYEDIELKFHGVVAAAGAGYIFSLGETPFDVYLRYETVIANGGSNNLISLGITRYFSFGRKDD